jgi:hypothetical protein
VLNTTYGDKEELNVSGHFLGVFASSNTVAATYLSFYT